MKPFLIAFAASLAVCALSHALATAAPPDWRPLAALPLYPGLALFTALNGSLLFGGGLGGAGADGVVVVTAAGVWAGLVGVVWRWVGRETARSGR